MVESMIVPCVSCGALNRVPVDRLEELAVCADCRGALLDSDPHDVDTRVFQRLVEKSDLPIVVDFWAAWCGPCQAMAPHFVAAARELRGRALLVKLDTEAEPAVAGRYGIQSIPTMIVFRGGHEVARTSGAVQAPQIVRWVTQFV